MTSDELESTLGRLLGPAGEEVGCDECFEHLDAYVELELAGKDAEAALPGFAPTSPAVQPVGRSTTASSSSRAATPSRRS